MKKNFDIMQNEILGGDAVVARGQDIYGEWSVKNLSSREIVAFTERVMASLRQKRSKEAHLETLSCLYALDTRIKTRYSNLLHCLFSFFSWRREKRALKHMQALLGIKERHSDMCSLIELALQKLVKENESDNIEDDDDETRGGKQTQKAEESARSTEKKDADQPSEEAPEEITDKENEAAEKTDEEILTGENQEEHTEKIEYEVASAEDIDQEAEQTHNEEKEDFIQEKHSETKEENNGPEQEAELIKNTSKAVNQDNGAIDIPHIGEERVVEEKKTEKLSFIDEVIIDNMVKGKEDFVTHNPLEDVREQRMAEQATEIGMVREKVFYDLTPDGEMLSVEMSDTQTISEIKTGGIQSQSLQENSVKSDDARVQIEIDMTQDVENEMIGDLNDSLTEEMVQYIKAAMEIDAKEQMRIASEELGIDAPVEIIGKTDIAELQQPNAAPNRD